LILGIGIGYVLGTRAGRERYEQIREGWSRFSGSPTVRRAAGRTKDMAGGQGQRMGMPKGLMRLNDVPILASLHNRLAWPGPTILVTTPGREKPPGQ